MSIILNKGERATNPLQQDALDILEAGLEAIDTEKILRNKLRIENGILYIKNINEEAKVELPSPSKVIFIGIGKCALHGAKVIQDILGDYLTEGAVIDVQPAADAEALASRGKIKYFQGTHPLPSEQNIEATKEILEMVENLTPNDLVLCLISGGGSSLFELPVPGVTLEGIIEKTKELTTKGADIYELNAARKEMSQVKGGKFAEACLPAQVISLIFSDVLGNDMSMIASGPTAIDSPSVTNILLVSNRDALSAMKSKAEELGYNASIETETLSGNAAEVGKELVKKEIEPKSCLLFGGETTVKISVNHGIGGRNQELALSALLNIPDLSTRTGNTVLISAASDGWDNTDHAGAMADREIFEKAKNLNLNAEDFLERSDSYNFWKNAGGAISTGKLGSNVSDLVIILHN